MVLTFHVDVVVIEGLSQICTSSYLPPPQFQPSGCHQLRYSGGLDNCSHSSQCKFRFFVYKVILWVPRESSLTPTPLRHTRRRLRRVTSDVIVASLNVMLPCLATMYVTLTQISLAIVPAQGASDVRSFLSLERDAIDL